jgi:hypothetical protein
MLLFASFIALSTRIMKILDTSVWAFVLSLLSNLNKQIFFASFFKTGTNRYDLGCR